jgi:hypothetical protein
MFRFPWWVRFLAKGLAIVGGFLALFFAILGLLTFTPRCMIAVILQGYATLHIYQVFKALIRPGDIDVER